MKKLITILMAILAVMPSLGLAAEGLPQLNYIGIKLISNIPSGVSGTEIQITDASLGITRNYFTNEVGEVVVLASDFGNFRATDTFNIVVSICSSDSRCQYSSVIGDFIVHTFDLTKSYCFSCPEPTICPLPEQPPSCESQGYVLPTTCPTIEPESGINQILTLVAGLVLLIGGGFKIYKNTAGQAVMQHKHTGIRGYHDVNIKHSNALYSHRRYKDDPIGFAFDVKRINEKGSL